MTAGVAEHGRRKVDDGKLDRIDNAAEYHAARCGSERLQAMIFRAWDRFAELHNVSFEHARILNMNTGIRL